MDRHQGQQCRCPHGPRCTRGPRHGGPAAAALDTHVRAFPMDAEEQALWRACGMNPVSLESDVTTLLTCLHYILPGRPVVSHHAALSALLPPPHDGADRISDLPDDLLRNIVSRLPAKDGARTAALSCRWRTLWLSIPLVLVDADLLPAGRGTGLQVARADARRVASAITRILEAHQGPFHFVHLISCYMQETPGLLARWLQLLAVKGVRELFLVNRPWPLNLALPATFFGMATLTRLYLGAFGFPRTAGLPRAVAFPHLRELGLCCIAIQNRDMNFVLARSPVLEILCIQANILLKCLTIVSRSLRCVQIIEGIDLNIDVKDAPHLERLIIWTSSARDGLHRSLNIGHAPALSMLGYLEPARHVLQIGNTTIKAGIRASPSTIVPSIKILSLRVCFGIRHDDKMLPSFLRCFPNVERLHLESNEAHEPTGKLNTKCWKEAGPIECIQSNIKLMIFYAFRGERNELSFLKFILENARMLTKLVIVYCKGSFSSMTEANSKVKPLFAAKWASQDCVLQLFESALEVGDDKWLMNFETGSDFSTGDPFACTAALRGCNI
ncbi:hypothetical protein QYE76_064886 [Lolium multiflorum]|uniref:F-box domain-containing protein n=1 Tax=Lolium multiflorum TaxID=4521 RepID=A0AAD8S915_LOLMU|nr:hypothetical protein QYE76_064886 [Lolium multiflorum]